MKILIPWAMNQFGRPELTVQRLVVNSKLPEADNIRFEGERSGLPVILDDVDTEPQPGDLWVGLCPKKGWGDVAGEAGEARTIEAGIVLHRLRNGKRLA